VVTVVLNAGAFAFLAGRSWNEDRDLRLDAGAALAGAPRTDLLLSADPGRVRVLHRPRRRRHAKTTHST